LATYTGGQEKEAGPDYRSDREELIQAWTRKSDLEKMVARFIEDSS
jgi:hypothetical protein